MSKLAMLRTLPSSQEKPLLQAAQEQVQTLTEQVQSLQSQLQGSANQLQKQATTETELRNRLKKAKQLKQQAEQQVQSLKKQRLLLPLVASAITGILVFAVML
jgi:chromosome segregation ATPase